MIVERAQWENKEHTCFTAWVSSDTYNNMPYGVVLDSDDQAPMYNEIIDLYNAKAFEIEEYQEPEISEENLAEEIRNKRDRLLSQSDKYMLPDYPISDDDRTLIRGYRQALRDITKQESFPLSVEFPKFPL